MYTSTGGTDGERTTGENMDDNCLWEENPDGQWETTCEQIFEFNNGGPENNGFGFCPYCGKKLVEKPYTEKEIE